MAQQAAEALPGALRAFVVNVGFGATDAPLKRSAGEAPKPAAFIVRARARQARGRRARRSGRPHRQPAAAWGRIEGRSLELVR